MKYLVGQKVVVHNDWVGYITSNVNKDGYGLYVKPVIEESYNGTSYNGTIIAIHSCYHENSIKPYEQWLEENRGN